MPTRSRSRGALAEAIAYAIVWVVCSGLSLPDARQQYAEADAAIREAVQAGGRSWRRLLPIVLAWARGVSADHERWSWKVALEYAMDAPARALLAVLPVAGIFAALAWMVTGSIRRAALVGAVTALLTLLVRGLRIAGHSVRGGVDPDFGRWIAQEASRWLTLPNVISFVRLCSGAVVLLLLVRGERFAALYWLAALVASDWLDGMLARRLRQVTVLGKRLDPAADRVTMLLAEIGLLGWHRPSKPIAVLVALMALRNAVLLVGGIVALLDDSRHAPGPNGLGKLASAVEMGAVLALATPHVIWRPSAAEMLEFAVCLVVLVLGAQSLAQYWDGVRDPLHGWRRSYPPPNVDLYDHNSVSDALRHPLFETLGELYDEAMWADDTLGLGTKDPVRMLVLELERVRDRAPAATAAGIPEDPRIVALETLILLIKSWRAT